MQKSISSPEYISLIQWLTEARRALGWGMRELAAELDEPHSFVQKVESLERRLDVYEYVVYCRALGLNPSAGLRFFVNPSQDKK